MPVGCQRVVLQVASGVKLRAKPAFSNSPQQGGEVVTHSGAGLIIYWQGEEVKGHSVPPTSGLNCGAIFQCFPRHLELLLASE